MNELQTNQYERIARGLDGSEEALTGPEQAVAEEIRRLEAGLYSDLDIRLPAGVLSRVQGRWAEQSSRRRRVIRLRVFSGMAAAAGLLLAVAVAYWIRGGPGSVGPGNGPSVAQAPTDGGAADGMDLAATDALLRTSRNADLDLLSREMNELEAETVAAAPSADVELDALEGEFYDLVIEDGTMPGPGL